jgi:hypothetical protein
MGIRINMDTDLPSDWIEAIVDTFDFTLPGRAGASLGEDLAADAADGIAQRSSQGLDVDGNPFKPNEADYAEYKLKRYSVDRPGELSGQTFSLASCLGKPEVSPDLIKLVHGTGESPDAAGYTRSRMGTELKPWERKATDTDKGGYLTEQGRPFYAIDAAGEESIGRRADESLKDHIAAAGD